MAENGGGGAMKGALGWRDAVVDRLLFCHFGSIIAESALFVNTGVNRGVATFKW